MFRQPPHDLDLLLARQAHHRGLNHIPDTRLVDGNKALIIHKREKAHDELAIHAVGDAAVAGDGFAKVFDLEGAFEAGGEEAAEGGDQRGEGGEDEDVELHGRDVEGLRVAEEVGEVVGLRDEDWVGDAGEAGEDVGAEVLRGKGVSVVEVGGWSWDEGVVRTLTGQMKYL